MMECFHREREDGYCWRCQLEKEESRLDRVKAPQVEEGLEEIDSDSEPEH